MYVNIGCRFCLFELHFLFRKKEVDDRISARLDLCVKTDNKYFFHAKVN